MSADRLREAARLLRDRAEAAEAVIGTGWYTPSMLREMTVEAEVAPFINAMHPGVGLALAQWLDDLAAGWAWDEQPHDDEGWTLDEVTDSHAVKIADLLLGGAS